MRSHTAGLVVMASTARIPLLTGLVTRLTDEPRVEAATFGGVCCTLVRPQGTEPRGTIVFLNGGTRLGCNHPAAQRLVRGMGRIGCLVVACATLGTRPSVVDMIAGKPADNRPLWMIAAIGIGLVAVFGIVGLVVGKSTRR